MIDHRIIQQIGIRDNAPALNMFQNTLSQVQNRNIQQQQADQQAELQPLRRQLVEQQVAQGQQQLDQGRQQQVLKSVNDFAISNASLIQNAQQTGDFTDMRNAMIQRKAQLQQQGLPTETTDEGIALIDAGQGDQVIAALGDNVNLYNQQQGRGKSAGQREFDNLVSVAQDPNATELERNSANRALGNLAKVSSSATERIAQDDELGRLVVDQAGAEAKAKEVGKSKVQLKFKPKINKAVKLAEKEAIERGDVLTELGRMEASLPGVKEVVSELLELSDIATSTLGGKAFDFVVKQSGFGSTKGATAKAKMEAIVDNQVLPLLKETFGAAFTASEGEALKASLVDPDSSPAQRKAQLDAFLAQKERNVRAKQNQVNQTFEFDAQGNLIQ